MKMITIAFLLMLVLFIAAGATQLWVLAMIGGGIFLCTPNNINVQGKITEETDGKDIHDNDDINIEW